MVTMCTKHSMSINMKAHEKETHCYYGLQVAIGTPPTENNTPKREATNWRLVLKCTAHIMLGQISSVSNLVTT